jgi:hypothetical protein
VKIPVMRPPDWPIVEREQSRPDCLGGPDAAKKETKAAVGGLELDA